MPRDVTHRGCRCPACTPPGHKAGQPEYTSAGAQSGSRQNQWASGCAPLAHTTIAPLSA
ncbi:hypothetical protein D805_1766 [Bifidobacterium thermophilum RBL67]|uniref:Uncharacterized protein n=1 Tax=Bifidobacterium thermophilum RBL67 TaxID=1254439 RepID=M4RHJ2_9BIFI|nr:hypothetical protein D805_1766 [Bifidobacterium thermophilum RBL67]